MGGADEGRGVSDEGCKMKDEVEGGGGVSEEKKRNPEKCTQKEKSHGREWGEI